jgi:hypothetical protein
VGLFTAVVLIVGLLVPLLERTAAAGRRTNRSAVSTTPRPSL